MMFSFRCSSWPLLGAGYWLWWVHPDLLVLWFRWSLSLWVFLDLEQNTHTSQGDRLWAVRHPQFPRHQYWCFYWDRPDTGTVQCDALIKPWIMSNCEMCCGLIFSWHKVNQYSTSYWIIFCRLYSCKKCILSKILPIINYFMTYKWH